MLNIAICDDNAITLNELNELVNKIIIEEHSIKVFDKAEQLIKHVNASTETIDIIITDIKMPEIDGIQLAKRIKNQHPNIHFIFVTSYSDYIQDVFSVNPVHYVLKPIKKEKLTEAIALAIDRITASRGNTINFVSKNKALRLRIDDIQYVESINRTAIFHLLNSNNEINIKLDDVEASLPSNFIRCHKSYLVNMNLVHEVSNNRITLFSNVVIPVAKIRFHDVKKKILEYWGDSI